MERNFHCFDLQLKMADTKFDKEILKFSIKGTNELEKVKEMLKEAEKRRKKLIENINNLKELVSSLCLQN